MQLQQLAAAARRNIRNKRKVRNNVVSLRITDQEKRVLDRIGRNTHTNLSDLVREAIDFWLTRRKGICLEP